MPLAWQAHAVGLAGFIISPRLPRASHGGKQACQANGME